MKHILTCGCGEVLIKVGDGVTKVRNKMIVFKNNKCYAVCRGCGKEIDIPMTLNNAAITEENRRPKLFLHNRR